MRAQQSALNAANARTQLLRTRARARARPGKAAPPRRSPPCSARRACLAAKAALYSCSCSCSCSTRKGGLAAKAAPDTSPPPRGITAARFTRTLTKGDEQSPVHLRDEGSPQGRPAEAGDLEGDLAVVLPGREDRRGGAQRRRQVLAAPDHGRRGQGLPGRGLGREGHADRLP